MISIFSVHVTLGLVDPQLTSEEIADTLDLYSKKYGVRIGRGVAVVVPRPIPEDEEQEAIQAITPGTHEVNLIFDFDPNSDIFLSMLAEDSMWNRYNVVNQLCTTITFASLKTLDSVPTYFSIKLSSDYIENELYEKIKKHRFNL